MPRQFNYFIWITHRRYRSWMLQIINLWIPWNFPKNTHGRNYVYQTATDRRRGCHRIRLWWHSCYLGLQKMPADSCDELCRLSARSEASRKQSRPLNTDDCWIIPNQRSYPVRLLYQLPRWKYHLPRYLFHGWLPDIFRSLGQHFNIK